jgi:hypothetical protein
MICPGSGLFLWKNRPGEHTQEVLKGGSMKKGRSVVWPLLWVVLLGFSCTSGELQLPDKGITILTPKANDVVKAGSSYEIQWKTEVPKSEFGEMVTVEFSPDSGKAWEMIKDNVPNTGTYAWKAAEKASPKSKVRVISQFKPEYRGTSGVFAVQ